MKVFFGRKTGPAMLAPVISRQRNSIQNVLVEKQNLNSKKNLDENLKKIQSSQIFKQPPPKWVFSTSVGHRALKLSTHMQVHNTHTLAKFQGHSPIITPFTAHMCDVQGHYDKNVNFVIYPYDHIRM